MAVLDNATFPAQVLYQYIDAGKPFTLPCQIPHSLPEPETHWVKFNGSTDYPQRIYYTDRITSDSEGNILCKDLIFKQYLRMPFYRVGDITLIPIPSGRPFERDVIYFLHVLITIFSYKLLI